MYIPLKRSLRDLRIFTIAKDQTGEASFDQVMEPWIGQQDALGKARSSIVAKYQDPQFFNSIRKYIERLKGLNQSS